MNRNKMYVRINNTRIKLNAEIIYYECCFDPDTEIIIDFEGHTKKIKDFEVGDTVVVESTKTGKKCPPSKKLEENLIFRLTQLPALCIIPSHPLRAG